LAACPAFQTWVGAADAEEALPRIHLTALPAPADGKAYSRAELEALRPLAVIWTGGWNGQREASGAAGHEFAFGGEIRMRFAANVDPEIATDNSEIDLELENAVGAILGELSGLSGTAAGLSIRTISLAQPTIRANDQAKIAEGDVVEYEVVIHWGD
jgi:molybdopterin converting factor small subunit